MVPSSNENEFKKEKIVIAPTNEIFTLLQRMESKSFSFLLEELIYKNITEEHKEFEDLYPTCLYGKSKIEIEKTQRFIHKFKSQIYHTKTANVYGNFYNLNFNQGLIPNTIYNFKKRRSYNLG